MSVLKPAPLNRKMTQLLDIVDMEKAVGRSLHKWAEDCHAVSLAIVKSDLLQGPHRVARGWCEGVPGQHSWIVCGHDCYAKDAEIIDPTLWSYDDDVGSIWYGSAADGRHHPDGEGNIWKWGRPTYKGGIPIELEGLSEAAQSFMEMMYPLDVVAWQVLASQAPVGGWPAGEVLAAMHRHDELKSLVPIDRLGMLTDINPGGLYLPGEEKHAVKEQPKAKGES